MISFLASLLVALVVCGILYWIVQVLPIPAPIKRIALVVVALILVVWILAIAGITGPPWRVQIR